MNKCTGCGKEKTFCQFVGKKGQETKTCQDCRDKIAGYSRAYSASNRDTMNAKARAKRTANIDEMREKEREYRNRPEVTLRRREYQRRYRQTPHGKEMNKASMIRYNKKKAAKKIAAQDDVGRYELVDATLIVHSLDKAFSVWMSVSLCMS